MKKPSKWFILVLLAGFIVPLTVMFYPQPSHQNIRLYANNTLFAQEINSAIALGSNAERTKELLEENGFSCQFIQRKRPQNASKHLPSHTLYNCHISKRGILPRRWTVIVAFKNNRIIGYSTEYDAIYK